MIIKNMVRANSQGVIISDRKDLKTFTTRGGGATLDAVSIDVGGGQTTTTGWNRNSILCCALTSLLILAGIGVATWYTVEEMNISNSNSTGTLLA